MALVIASSITSCGNSAIRKNELKEGDTFKKKNEVVVETKREGTGGVDYNDISISGVKLGEELKTLYKFGKEDSVTADSSDFESNSLKRYYWGKSYFEVDSKGKISGFLVKDKRFVLETLKVKVGDAKSFVEASIKKSFPHPENAEGGVLRSNGNYILLRIGVTDDYIGFTFKGEILTDYGTWNDL